MIKNGGRIFRLPKFYAPQIDKTLINPLLIFIQSK